MIYVIPDVAKEDFSQGCALIIEGNIFSRIGDAIDKKDERIILPLTDAEFDLLTREKVEVGVDITVIDDIDNIVPSVKWMTLSNSYNTIAHKNFKNKVLRDGEEKDDVESESEEGYPSIPAMKSPKTNFPDYHSTAGDLTR